MLGVERVRKQFEKNDIFIYMFILILIISLFLFCFLSPSGKSFGFICEYDGEKIFSFRYSDKSYYINENFTGRITLDLDNSTVTIFFDDEKTEYNVIQFDCGENKVKVTDSTCSISKDCTKIPAIVDKKNTIYCNPHRLKIVSLNKESILIPSTGA